MALILKLKHKYRPERRPRFGKKLVHCRPDFAGIRKGQVCVADLSQLHPTQATVGYIQSYEQAKKYSKMSRAELEEALLKKPIPVVIGPDRKAYIIDHHHHAATLWIMGLKQ